MSLIDNERAKLTATYVNGLAIAVFAVGGLAPLFSILLANAPSALPTWAIWANAAVCWIVSGGLHNLARHVLRKLVP